MMLYLIALISPRGSVSRAADCRSGFSLVLALMLMSFVLVLLLSITAMIRVETVASAQQRVRLESRQNALLGLMVSLGELQKHAGVDQRITARADVLEEGGAVVADSFRNLTGVWDSSGFDARSAKPGGPGAWLVSYPESGNAALDVSQEIAGQLPEGGYVQLIGEGSNGGLASPEHSVQAGLLPIEQGDTIVGSFAYWVGDEGVKARLFLPSEERADQLESVRVASQRRLGGSLSPRSQVVAGLAGLLPSADSMEKMFSNQQISLMPGISDVEVSSLEERRHDFSLYSVGLLTNAKDGGLKKDLSLAFEMGDLAFNGVPEFTGTRANISENFQYKPIFTEDLGGGVSLEGPTWHLLRNYYRLYQEVDWSAGSLDITARSLSPSTQSMRAANGGSHFMYDMSRYYSGRNAAGARLFTDASGGYLAGAHPRKATAPSIAPIVSRMQYIFSLRAEPLEAGDPVPAGGAAGDYRKLSLIFDRIVVVWNPYNVPIRFNGIASWYNQGSVPVSVHLKSLGGELLVRDSGGTVVQKQFADADRYGWFAPESVRLGSFLDELSSTGSYLTDATNNILQPGELRVLSASDSQPNNQDNVNSRILTEGFNSAGGIRVPLEFYDDGDGQDYLVYIESAGRVQARLEGRGYEPGGFIGGGRMQAEHYLIEDPTTTIAELGAFDSNTGLRGFDKVSNLATVEFNLAEADTNSDFEGWSLPVEFATAGEKIGFGVLDIYLKPGGTNEDPIVCSDYSPLAASATLTYLHEQGYIGTPPNWTFRVKEISDLVSDTAIVQSSGNGRYAFWGDSITAAGGQNNVSLFEVPTAPIQSIGSLRHAPLSVISEHPMYAFGASRAHPALDSEQVVQQLNSWEGASLDFFDLSYLSNQAIWDGYFFSSIAPRETGMYTGSGPMDLEDVLESASDGSVPLPNSGYRLSQSQVDLTAGLLAGGAPRADAYQKVARYLEVDGMFNVNSTSVAAWATVLAGVRDLQIETLGSDGSFSGGIDGGDHSIYGRSRLPNGDQSNKWSGFIALTDDDIWMDGGTPHDYSDDSGLAYEIVQQVKNRGPFLNLSDFVNRRLRDDALGQKGALQAAIDNSGVNDAVTNTLDSSDVLATLRNPEAATGSQSLGASGVLDQGDLLAQLGPYLNVRSDTFTIRFYGESLDPITGDLRSKSVGEAIVQRVISPVNPSNSDPNEDGYWVPSDGFGRQFKIISVNWLDPREV